MNYNVVVESAAENRNIIILYDDGGKECLHLTEDKCKFKSLITFSASSSGHMYQDKQYVNTEEDLLSPRSNTAERNLP